MATSWASQRCLEAGASCQWLHWHRMAATPAALSVLLFVAAALLSGRWGRSQWPLLCTALLLVGTQIALGVSTLRLGLSQPALTVAHQLVACLLVAVLAALKRSTKRSNLEAATRIAVAESRYERCAREVAAQQARQIAGEAS